MDEHEPTDVTGDVDAAEAEDADENQDDAVDESIETADAIDGGDGDGGGAADAFDAELVAARELLDADGIDAVHVGVVRDGDVDTTFTQRTADDPQTEGLRALALLAAHLKLVADEAGVDAATVAGDAATLAGQVERIPASTADLPEE